MRVISSIGVSTVTAVLLAGPAVAQPAFDPDAWARRIADPSTRARAFEDAGELTDEQKITVWRKGLWLESAEAAALCAERLEHDQVDVKEARRVIALLMPRIDGHEEVDWFDEFRQLLGSREVTTLLAAWPQNIPDWFGARIINDVHRQLRPRHIPALCALAERRDRPITAGDAMSNLGGGVLPYTNAHRERAARTFLVTVGRDPEVPAKPDGWPALLSAGIEAHLLDEKRPRGEWGRWFGRWVRDAEPGPSDLPLLARLAAHPADAAGRAAALGLGRLDSDAAGSLLVELRDRVATRRTSEVRPLVLWALARRGDADAADQLAALAREEALALGLLFRVDRSRAQALATELLSAPPDDGADLVLEAFDSDELLYQGVDLGRDDAAGIVAAMEKCGAPVVRVARVVAALPGCRDAATAVRLARDPALLPDEGDTIDGFVALLEACDKDAAATLLRRWADGPDPLARAHGMRRLLRLGLADDGPRLVAWLRSGAGNAETLVRLGAVPSPAVRDYLREQIRDALAAGTDDARTRAHLRALAVWHGLPRELAWVRAASKHIGLAQIAPLVLDGRPDDALAQLLDANVADDELMRGVHWLGLHRTPRARAHLLAAREMRTNGLHPWATRQLALQGNREARADLRSLYHEGRYRWIDNSDARELTFDRDLASMPFLLDELQAACCRSNVADQGWEALFGFECETGWVPRIEQAERWLRIHQGKPTWSRIAGHYVPGPE